MNQKESFFGDVRKHLMSGVSFMLPVIIIYAFFMVLGQLPGSVGELFATISTTASGFIGPILAAYIAFSIVGKLGLAPTFIVALIGEQMGMGFIGGLIIGLLMGYIIKALIVLSKKFKEGQANDILMSFIIVPMLATMVGALLIHFVIGTPLINAMDAVYSWLETLSGANIILLSAILGLMIAFDMGGPVNKVAYTFAIAASTEGLNHIVAPVLVAITVPVLAIGLATIIFKKHYDEDERLEGKTALFMSVFGLTEGAIPFAVINPFRVIPALMAGSMVGAVTAAIFTVENSTVIPSLIGLAVGSPTLYDAIFFVVAHLVGVAVTVALLIVLKKKDEEVI
jgi:fructose-specific phosphotransferase system IIC component